jgi:hypothetical protein
MTLAPTKPYDLGVDLVVHDMCNLLVLVANVKMLQIM